MTGSGAHLAQRKGALLTLPQPGGSGSPFAAHAHSLRQCAPHAQSWTGC